MATGSSIRTKMLIAKADIVEFTYYPIKWRHDKAKHVQEPNMTAYYYVHLDNENGDEHMIFIERLPIISPSCVKLQFPFQRADVHKYVIGNTLRVGEQTTRKTSYVKIEFQDKISALSFHRQINGWIGRRAVACAHLDQRPDYVRLIRRLNFNNEYYDSPTYFRRASWPSTLPQFLGQCAPNQIPEFAVEEYQPARVSVRLRQYLLSASESCPSDHKLLEFHDDPEEIRRYFGYNDAVILRFLDEQLPEALKVHSLSVRFEAPFNRPHPLLPHFLIHEPFAIPRCRIPDRQICRYFVRQFHADSISEASASYKFPMPNLMFSLLFRCFVEVPGRNGEFQSVLIILPESIATHGSIQLMMTYGLTFVNGEWKMLKLFVAATELFGNEHNGLAAQPIRWLRIVALGHVHPLWTDRHVKWAFTLLGERPALNPKNYEILVKTKLPVRSFPQVNDDGPKLLQALTKKK